MLCGGDGNFQSMRCQFAVALWVLSACAATAQTAPLLPAKPGESGVKGVSQAVTPAPTVTIPMVEIVAATESDDALRRNASIAKSTYGREELDRHGDIDITDVLKRLPGVSMDGASPRLRGLGGGYTQVLINGEPAPPGFSLETLAPGDVERIEVIKGSTAEYAGVAGTINVVLREPPKTLQREWRSGVSYRALQPGGVTAFQWGDRYDTVSFVLPVSVSRGAQGTSYDLERISRTPAGEVRSQAIAGDDAGRTTNAQMAPRLQWKISDTDTFQLSGFAQQTQSVSDTHRQIIDILGSPSVTVADTSQTWSTSLITRAQLSWSRKLTDGTKWELKGFSQRTARYLDGSYRGWQSDGSVSLQRVSNTRFEELRSTLGGRWNQPLGAAHTLLTGWDLETREREELRRVWDNGVERQDDSDGVLFQSRIQRRAIFAQDEWALSDQWSLLPGFRFEEVVTQSGASPVEIDNAARIAAPVLHVNYRWDPKGKDQVRGSVTRSFKLPDLGALLGRYVVNTTYERDVTNTPIAADRAGNPLLRPELATGFDLAYEHYPTSGGVFSAGLFYRRIEDLIRQSVTLQTQPWIGVPRWVARPVNFGVAHSAGLEIEIKGRAEEWLPQWFGPDSGVQLRSGWNVYRSEVEQVNGPDNRLEAQPPWSANMGFDARLKNSGWTLGASLVLRPAYTTQQTDRQVAQRSALRTLDAFAAWKIDRSMQWRFAVANLLAPDNETSNTVEDIDGFFAGSHTRRNTLRTWSASLVMRF